MGWVSLVRVAPAAVRAEHPALPVDLRATMAAELAIGGDVGEPTVVVAGSPARHLDRAERPEIDIARQVQGQLGGGSHGQRAGAQFGLGVRVGRPEARGDLRAVAEGDVVGHGGAAEEHARQGGQPGRDQDPADEPAAAHRGLPEDPSREPEPGEQARRGEREQPRVGRLERGQQRLRPERAQLHDESDHRRNEHEQRDDPKPDHGGERAAAVDHRRPDDAEEGDPQRDEGQQAHDDVDRPARSVGQQHKCCRQRPTDDERDGDQPQFEGPDSHARSLAGGLD